MPTNIVDYAYEDNGSEFRKALYASIQDKVEAHIEAKKQEIAQGMLATQEAVVWNEDKLEEAVSRKDFRMVADLIKTHEDHGKRKELAQHHAEIFHRQNPRFDRKKFMAAANVQE